MRFRKGVAFIFILSFCCSGIVQAKWQSNTSLRKELAGLKKTYNDCKDYVDNYDEEEYKEKVAEIEFWGKSSQTEGSKAYLENEIRNLDKTIKKVRQLEGEVETLYKEFRYGG